MQYPAPGTYFAWLADKGRDRVADAGAGEGRKEGPDAGARPAAPAAERFVRHKVARGESLTRLAAHYQVSMNALREVNGLRDDNVKIGQILKIPAN